MNKHREGAARHWTDAGDHFDVDERASRQPHKERRIETYFKFLQTIVNGIALIIRGRDSKQLSVRNYGGNLSHGKQNNLAPLAHWYALQIRNPSSGFIVGHRRAYVGRFFRSKVFAFQTLLSPIQCLAETRAVHRL